MSFEPFFDYGRIDDEMAKDIRDVLIDLRDAQDDLVDAETEKERVEAARRVMDYGNEIRILTREINEDILAIPALVHVAGETVEEDENGDVIYVQRCERCGSELSISDIEDDEFFDAGTKVGKVISDGNSVGMASSMIMYQIGNRKLDKHEYECLSFAQIFDNS